MQLSGRCVLFECGFEARYLGECVHVDWDVGTLVGVFIDHELFIMYVLSIHVI